MSELRDGGRSNSQYIFLYRLWFGASDASIRLGLLSYYCAIRSLV